MSGAEIWNKMSWLESHDAVGAAYEKIHSRVLNARRRLEIAASSRQAREYFAQASMADLSVRPLLTFYGVSSLSRACILLLGEHSGEISLAAAHGLQTVDWRRTLDGDLPTALSGIGGLKINVCGGLYSDLVKHTDNTICVHVNSSAVQWHLSYPQPTNGAETDIDGLITRLPDLQDEVLKAGLKVKFMPASDMTYDTVTGFQVKATERVPSDGLSHYSSVGYSVTSQDGRFQVSAPTETFEAHLVQLVHKYASPIFGIPECYIAEPLWRGSSQICLVFKLSYVLGMLARYFPTHWMSLVNGAKGDIYRASLLQSQNVVEKTFPSLVHELIAYKTAK